MFTFSVFCGIIYVTHFETSGSVLFGHLTLYQRLLYESSFLVILFYNLSSFLTFSRFFAEFSAVFHVFVLSLLALLNQLIQLYTTRLSTKRIPRSKAGYAPF